MATPYNFDLFVIGAGSGGVRAARIAAGYGARVAIAEERYLGGTCVNVGCVPKKMLVHAAHLTETLALAPSFGWSVPEPAIDWPALIANKDTEITRLNSVYADVLEKAGVEHIDGRATLLDAHTVTVNDRTITAQHILIATGSWPRFPDIPGAEHAITSNEAFFLDTLPERVIIVGGGYIAVEFAGIFHGLGSDVVQLYRGDQFLRGFDDDVRTALADAMRGRGIDLRFNLNVAGIAKEDGGLRATLSDGSELDADQVMFAIGRVPNSAGLGLEDVGVETTASGAIVVDELSQTTVPGVHAIGDVTSRLNLTPVAIAEGMALAATLFDDRPTSPDYDNVPSAVFSSPPIGSVGLTEETARARHDNIQVYRSSFRPLMQSLSDIREQTFMKLVVDTDTDRVVGLHMVGPDAAEIVQGFAVALKCGATKAQFDATIGIHPTAAEEFVSMRAT